MPITLALTVEVKSLQRSTTQVERIQRYCNERFLKAHSYKARDRWWNAFDQAERILNVVTAR